MSVDRILIHYDDKRAKAWNSYQVEMLRYHSTAYNRGIKQLLALDETMKGLFLHISTLTDRCKELQAKEASAQRCQIDLQRRLIREI